LSFTRGQVKWPGGAAGKIWKVTGNLVYLWIFVQNLGASGTSAGPGYPWNIWEPSRGFLHLNKKRIQVIIRAAKAKVRAVRGYPLKLRI
jgi:hypothetical protein